MGPKKRWRDKGKLPPPVREKSKDSRRGREKAEERLNRREESQQTAPIALKRGIDGQEGVSTGCIKKNDTFIKYFLSILRGVRVQL